MITEKQEMALTNFLDAWDETSVVGEIGGHFTCLEAEVFEVFLREMGREQMADEFIRSHAAEDGDGDWPEHLEIKKGLEAEP